MCSGFGAILVMKHLKSACHKVRNIGDRVFSKLYDVFKNHCNLSAHF